MTVGQAPSPSVAAVTRGDGGRMTTMAAGMLCWRYLDGSKEEVGSSERFGGRTDAESWLSGAWPDLRAEGVAEVELVDEATGETLYRMGLDEA